MTRFRWMTVSKVSAVIVSCLAMGLVVGGCSDSNDDDNIDWGKSGADASRDARAEARSDVDLGDGFTPAVDVVSDVVADRGSDSEPDTPSVDVVSDSSPEEDVSETDTTPEDAEADVIPDVPAETEPDPALAEKARNEIIAMAAGSSCASYSWKNRGKAPAGYMKGMALLFGRAVCNQTRVDVAYVAQAQPSDKGKDDTLVHYDGKFQELGWSNGTAGVDTLRHSYTLLLGLGMRESSGKYCEGRDRSASNTTAETAEAGLWQTSYNSRNFNKTILLGLFDKYKADKSGCLLDAFKEGVSCSSSSWESYGSGDGYDFQELSKSCPAFAGEWTAVMLRSCYRHYGPLVRREAELKPECDSMFKQVQDIISKTPTVCTLL